MAYNSVVSFLLFDQLLIDIYVLLHLNISILRPAIYAF